MIHKPQSLRQRVSIIAHDSAQFTLATESISAIAAFLQQESLDGPVDSARITKIFGMECIDAQTSLFTSKSFTGDCDDVSMPQHMDPDGRLHSHARRKSYRYTTENQVLYGESAGVAKITYVSVCSLALEVNRHLTAKAHHSSVKGGRFSLEYFDKDSSSR